MNYDPLLSDWISGSQKLALPGAINPISHNYLKLLKLTISQWDQ